MMDIKFTKFERIVISNQLEILKQLDKGNKDYYDERIEILKRGYSLFYSMINEVFEEEEMSDDECSLVLDILDFYSILERFKNNSDNNINEIKEIEQHKFGTFKGFDANSIEEIKYLQFTSFLIDNQGKFESIAELKKQTDDFNSHLPLLESYKRIIVKWKGYTNKYNLSKTEIIEIINCGMGQ